MIPPLGCSSHLLDLYLPVVCVTQPVQHSRSGGGEALAVRSLRRLFMRRSAHESQYPSNEQTPGHPPVRESKEGSRQYYQIYCICMLAFILHQDIRTHTPLIPATSTLLVLLADHSAVDGYHVDGLGIALEAVRRRIRVGESEAEDNVRRIVFASMLDLDNYSLVVLSPLGIARRKVSLVD
jgi:hypothetical protein